MIRRRATRRELTPLERAQLDAWEWAEQVEKPAILDPGEVDYWLAVLRYLHLRQRYADSVAAGKPSEVLRVATSRACKAVGYQGADLIDIAVEEATARQQVLKAVATDALHATVDGTHE